MASDRGTPRAGSTTSGDLHQELCEVTLRYARGIDRRDWALVRSCFAEDAIVVGSRDSGGVDNYLRDLRRGVEYFDVTMHFMGNQLIDLIDDHYEVETYAIAHHYRGESPGQPHPDDLVVGVIYHDKMVRETDRWRIRSRAVELLWRRGNYPPL